MAVIQPSLLPVVRNTDLPLRWIACTAADADADLTGTLSFAALRGDPAASPVRTCDALRPHSVQYTSGTTARPKGVVWTHANALWSGQAGAAHLRLSPDDVAMVYLPLFHTTH